MIDTDKIYKEWCKVRNLMFDKGVEVYHYRDLDEYILDLLAEVKRLREELGQLKLLAIRAYEANENRGTGECEDLKAIMEMIE